MTEKKLLEVLMEGHSWDTDNGSTFYLRVYQESHGEWKVYFQVKGPTKSQVVTIPKPEGQK